MDDSQLSMSGRFLVQFPEPAVSSADGLRRLLGNSRFLFSFYCLEVLRWAAAQTCAGVSPLHP
ncbi:MAG: hypothetical protein ACI4MJ_09040, partial [Aristaeellaceae bacterium]